MRGPMRSQRTQWTYGAFGPGSGSASLPSPLVGFSRAIPLVVLDGLMMMMMLVGVDDNNNNCML